MPVAIGILCLKPRLRSGEQAGDQIDIAMRGGTNGSGLWRFVKPRVMQDVSIAGNGSERALVTSAGL